MANGTVLVHWTAPDGATHLAGRLTSFGGSDFQRFTYADSWLSGPGFSLGEGLPLANGALTPPGGATEFGLFRDAAPDAWGRRVAAAKARPAPRTGTDFLLAAADETRQGALRFQRDGQFLADGGPEPVTMLRDLLREVELFQSGDPDTNGRIVHLLRSGTSQGGFRPKAAVADDRGRLWIAKFPMETDRYDVETCEAAALHVARDAGLNVPDFRHIRVDADNAVLLVARFDRTTGGRLGYQSMRTAMRLGEDEPYDYQGMAAAAGCLSGTAGRRAIVGAAALNIAVNNIDDHARNLGFLQSPDGRWALAPLFDIVPRPIPGAEPTPLHAGEDRSLEQLLDLDWELPRAEVNDIVTRVTNQAQLVFRIAQDRYGIDPESAENAERYVSRFLR